MSSSLTELWRATVRRAPATPALITAADEKIWTRAQLAGAADAWRAALPPGLRIARRRVAMVAGNGPEWWAVFLGLLAADAIPVMLDGSEPAGRQREIARQAGAVALWTAGAWVPLGRGRKPEEPAVALVKLTSGSMGRPRSWAFTQAQMQADGRQVCAAMGIRPADLNLAVIPLGHSYGLGNLVMPLLLQGTPLVVADSPFPHVLAAVAARWRPTVFPAVPTLLDALVRSEVAPGSFASLRLVVSAGAALPAALANELSARFGLVVHNFYGTSETGGICYDRSGVATRTGRSVGKPLRGVVLRWGRGRRFWVESAAACRPEGFSPPDLGRLNARGELEILGRAGRQIKIGARRVDLGEVEAAIRGIPGVRAVHVALVPGSAPVLAAGVATDLTSAALRAALRGQLAAWKLPERIMVLPSLPSSLRGKVDRLALEKILSEPHRPSGQARPVSGR